MDIISYAYQYTVTNEMPDKQPPAPSYPEPGQQAPMNPTPDMPGTDAPEVGTGTRINEEEPVEDIDPDDVGGNDAQAS